MRFNITEAVLHQPLECGQCTLHSPKGMHVVTFKEPQITDMVKVVYCLDASSILIMPEPQF